MGFSDRLESVDSASVAFPGGDELVQVCDEELEDEHILHLHDLSETALSNNLEQLEILNLERPLSVLDEFDTASNRTSSVLEVNPFSARLTLSLCSLSMSESGLLSVLSAQLGVFLVGVNFFKAGIDSAGSQEDVVVSTGIGRGVGVSDVNGQIEFADTGDIELVLCALTGPDGLLWCT